MTHFQRATVAILSASFFCVGASARPVAASGKEGFAPVQHQTSDKATAKAVRKYQGEEARANKNAELRKLESNGYCPDQSSPGYPENLQKARKMAA